MADHATSSLLTDDRDGAVFLYKGGQAPQHITCARIDKSVKIIDGEAFSSNSHLISVELHDSVELIRIMAFCNCTSLRRIKLLGVKDIEMGAFYNCVSLADVELGDELETIGDDTFAYCSSLKHITIPSARTIGVSSFNNCERLTSLDLPESLERVGQNALKNCPSLRRIAIPLKDQVFVGNDTLNCPNLSTVSLVGGIHTLIASSPLQQWKNEMTDELRRINKVLPRTAQYEKNDVIQRWAGALLVKIHKYKTEHNNHRILMEANAMLERALFIQSRT